MPAPALVHPNQLLRPYDGPKSISDQMQLASLLSQAAVGLPPEFKGDAGGILALMYRAMALDIPLMVAADNLVFSGRGICAMRARLMKALVTVRAGHRLVPVETTGKRAVVRLEYSEADGREPFTTEWTLATAVNAGLVKGNSPWVNYAENMLYWRAMAKAVALGCPEATLGIALVEALDDDADEDPGQDHPSVAPIPKEFIQINEGKPVPSEAVADFLNQLAQPDPETGRPLVRAEITIDDLRKAWNQANRDPGDGTLRPLKSFALAAGDDRFTLEQVISDLVEQATTRDRERAAKKAAEKAEITTPPQDLDAPAGSGTLPCGCDATTVATTGEHLEGCAK